jgi:hypothetical protein
MTTEAQRIANKKNAQKSTGPKSEAGKARAKLNALKHGRRAKTVAPVLPQEDPAALEARIRRWVEDMRPGDAAERELVTRAAKTSWELDRLERHETAKLDVRVRKAQVALDVETVNQVCDLGRRLLYMAGRRILPTSGPPWDDNPAAFLRGLESTAEGCRWLRDRWAELKWMFDRGDMWTLTDLYRSIRLQGKHPVDAVNDPDLNLQFLAWEFLAPTGATDFWARCYEMTPRYDPGFSGFMEWREIVERPASEEEAMAVLEGVIDGRIARLEEMIALYEEITGEEAIELADAASFDPGPEAEALRRRRSTLTRELRQLIELILKMQSAGRRRATFALKGTEVAEGEGPCDRRGANEADPRDREAETPGVEEGTPSDTDGTDRSDETGPGPAGDHPEEAGRRRRKPAPSGRRRISTRGVKDRQIAAESMTNEPTLQRVKALVEKRFREMLGLSETDERTRSPGARHVPTEETGQGRTSRADENQTERLCLEDMENTEEKTPEGELS